MTNLVGMPLPSGLTLLQTVNGTGASGVLTLTVPAGYLSAEIDLQGRGDQVATNTAVRVAFNADATATSYNDQQLQVSNTTLTGGENLGANGFITGTNVAAASSTANVHTRLKIELPEYAATDKFKVVDIHQGGALSLATGLVLLRLVTGVYESTSAITSVTLTLASGNWTTTTIARLWGKR